MKDDEYAVPSRGEFAFVPDRAELFLRIPFAMTEAADMSRAKFKLTGKESKYEVTLTGADDLIPGDDAAELMFEDCSAKDKYSLEVDPGNGKPKYFLFKDKPFRELAGIGSDEASAGSPGTTEA